MMKKEYDNFGILCGYIITTKKDVMNMLGKTLNSIDDIAECVKKLNNYCTYEHYDDDKYFGIKRITQRKYEVTLF